MDSLRLLVEPLESLSLSERARALVQAREAGRVAAGRARSAQELEEAPLSCFVDAVAVAAAGDAVTGEGRGGADDGRLLRDPRVQAFFFGWHERATEILAQLAEAPADSPLRARWFLDAIDALPSRDR